MYCRFFKFSEKPFKLTPDSRSLYLGPSHKEALASMIYGIRECRGFMILLGEVGTGKTTLLNAVIDKLDDKTKFAFVFFSLMPFEQMLNTVLVNLGLAKSAEVLTKSEAVNRLHEFAIHQLAKGGNVVIIVDEAQNLDYNALENLRLLSNLETRNQKLIQIILSGQPELEKKLAQYELRQLSQRFNLKRFISPFSEKQTYDYITTRLDAVDYKGPPLFTKRALHLIYTYSEGIPRKINTLCDNAFLMSYGLQKKRIDSHILKEAIKDLNCSSSDTRLPSLNRRDKGSSVGLKTKTYTLPFVFVACLVIFLCLTFSYHSLSSKDPLLQAEAQKSADSSQAEAQKSTDSSQAEAQKSADSSRAEAQKIIMSQADYPEPAKATVSKTNHYPYSLKLASMRSLENAKNLISKYKKLDISAYIVKAGYNERKGWWLVHLGQYPTFKEAEEAQKTLMLSQAIIRKVPYANLIGVYSSLNSIVDMINQLENMGYFPYFIEEEERAFRLFVGAFPTVQGAENQYYILRDDGIESQIVKR